MVDYSLQSIGNSDTRYLEAILQPPVTAGTIAGVPLASNDVSFLPVSGTFFHFLDHFGNILICLYG